MMVITDKARSMIRRVVAVATGLQLFFVMTIEKIEELIACHFRQGLVHQPAPRLHSGRRTRRSR